MRCISLSKHNNEIVGGKKISVTVLQIISSNDFLYYFINSYCKCSIYLIQFVTYKSIYDSFFYRGFLFILHLKKK
jgi:hypothetical protein